MDNQHPQHVDWAVKMTKEGERYTRHPNGKESFVDRHGNRRDVYPDGTSRIEFAHGGKIIQMNPEPTTFERLVLRRKRPTQMASDDSTNPRSR